MTVSRDNNSVLGLAELLVPHTIPPALTRELVIQCEFSKEPAPPSELPKFSFVTWHASCQYSFHLALSFCLFLWWPSVQTVPIDPQSQVPFLLIFYVTMVCLSQLTNFIGFLSFRFSEVKSKIASKWGSSYLIILNR